MKEKIYIGITDEDGIKICTGDIREWHGNKGEIVLTEGSFCFKQIGDGKIFLKLDGNEFAERDGMLTPLFMTNIKISKKLN